MVKQKSNKPVRSIKLRRHFSEELKREAVRKIEHHELGVSQALREYEVCRSTIYRWLYRYSLHLKKGNIVIVEKKSNTIKTEQYKQRIAELERIVGQKQLEIDVLNKTLDIGSEEVGFDIKKKYSGKLSGGTAAIKNNTPTS
jgi:transposase